MANEPCKPHDYALTGPQVEPTAGYWMFCSKLHIPTIEELTKVTDDPGNDDYFPPYPDPCSAKGKQQIDDEIEELVALSKRRDDPCSLVGAADGALDLGLRQPISKLLNLTPVALGAVMVDRLPGEQIIRTGRGMARAVESETPGLFHRHALNYLIRTRHWSPPRQALIWAALDVTIAGALQAAWYYKWVSPRPLVSRRERPIEYATRNVIDLQVLFDHPDELNPAFNLCPDGRKAGTMSGTPRHPAYPSGHSTYSGAASEFLSYFFAGQQQELNNMADNIGMGRLWAGIHWRTDHLAGMKLGRAVAHLVLQQLANMGIDLCPPEPPAIKDQCDPKMTVKCSTDAPPTLEELQKEAEDFRKNCSKEKKLGKPCEEPEGAMEQRLDMNRGVQRGGGNQ